MQNVARFCHLGIENGELRTAQYLSEVGVVDVGYHVKQEPVDLLDNLVEVGRKVVTVLNMKITVQQFK